MAGLELLYVSAQHSIKNGGDALVCALHWNMITNGFKCIGLGEEVPKSEAQIKRTELLPAGWSEDPSAYCLLYYPNNSIDAHVLKVILLENSLLVHLMRMSDNQVTSMSIDITDYTTDDLTSFEQAYTNIAVLQSLFTTELLEQMPKKDNSATAGASSSAKFSSNTGEKREQSTSDDRDPLMVGPPRRPPHCPSWTDPSNPLGVGRGDLFPGGVGGGMYMDPRGLPNMRWDPSTGIPGRLPPGAVPPGARFDPFGPPDPDTQGQGGSNPNRGRGSRAGRQKKKKRGKKAKKPDPDHLPPPGADDMFM